MRPVVILILFISIACSCSNKKKASLESQLLISYFDENMWTNKIYYKENTDVQMIFLNEKENLIGDISSMNFFNNFILIHERDRDLLFLYTINGEFISSVGNKGSGPDDYIKITYYDVYTHGDVPLIEILDANRHEIKVYDFYGNLIEKKKLKTGLNPMSFAHTNSGYFFHTPDKGNPISENHMLVLFSHDLKNIKQKYILDNNIFIPRQDNHFTKNSDVVYFHYGYNDTIYMIREEVVEPYLYIDFGSSKVANSDISSAKTVREYEDILYFSNNTYLGGINEIMVNDSKIMYRFSDIKINEQVNRYYGEYEYNNGISCFSKYIASDFPFGFSIKYLGNEFTVGIIYPYHLNNKGINYLNEIFSQNIEIKSNPILIKIYEK